MNILNKSTSVVSRSKDHCLFAISVLCFVALATSRLEAEVCTTQSQMAAGDKVTIVSTVQQLATLVQTNDAAALRTQTVPEYAKDFSAMTSLIATTAPKVQGAQLSVDQIYVLDATNLKAVADATGHETTLPDAQFSCTLNKSVAETEFLIPALPPGRYAFAIAAATTAKVPWEMSFLLRQETVAGAGRWLLAGFYPKPLTAAGHDGLWYWTHARELVKAKQPWSGYLFYQQAQTLLQPVGFVSSSHLDKLRKEIAASAPPSLSEGISPETPLVVKGTAGAEYRFTGFTTDDSLGVDKIDVLVHLQAEPAPEAGVAPAGNSKSAGSKPGTQPRERNANAMAALVAAFPELRSNFHGVWVFADAAGKNPFVTEEPMANIH